MNRQLLFKDKARAKLQVGIDMVADAAEVTLGPKGRHVVLDQAFTNPHVTKDGATVVKNIELEDPFENLGAKLIKEAAMNTNEEAGDGTTTSTVLARALVTEGNKAVAAGGNPVAIKRGMDKALSAVTNVITEYSSEITSREDIVRIGAISANNSPYIGELIAEAMDAVGRDGSIVIDTAKGYDTSLEVVKGMEFDAGYVSDLFVNNADLRIAEFSNARVLVTDSSLQNVQDLVALLQEIGKIGSPLIVIGEEFSETAVQVFAINKVQSNFNVCMVKIPEHGDRAVDNLKDIAAVTGATFVSKNEGIDLKQVTMGMLGSVSKATITKSTTSIVGSSENETLVTARIADAKQKRDATDSEYEIRKQSDRISRLGAGLAVIYVGGNSKTEQSELKDRIEDAIKATKAAVKEGIVPGGGTPFIKAHVMLKQNIANNAVEFDNKDEENGYIAVIAALRAPLTAICRNAGVEPGEIIGAVIQAQADVAKEAYGYNAYTEKYGDLLEMGVIDPTKVVRCAIKNAIAVAGMIITTDVAIVDAPPVAGAMPPMGGMPGMPGMM